MSGEYLQNEELIRKIGYLQEKKSDEQGTQLLSKKRNEVFKTLGGKGKSVKPYWFNHRM